MFGTLVLVRNGQRGYPRPGGVASFFWKNSGCSGPQGGTPRQKPPSSGACGKAHGLLCEEETLRAEGSSWSLWPPVVWLF